VGVKTASDGSGKPPRRLASPVTPARVAGVQVFASAGRGVGGEIRVEWGWRPARSARGQNNVPRPAPPIWPTSLIHQEKQQRMRGRVVFLCPPLSAFVRIFVFPVCFQRVDRMTPGRRGPARGRADGRPSRAVGKNKLGIYSDMQELSTYLQAPLRSFFS